MNKLIDQVSGASVAAVQNLFFYKKTQTELDLIKLLVTTRQSISLENINLLHDPF